MSATVLIVGCGDIGTRAGLTMARRGYAISGVRRDPQQLPAAIEPIAADVTDRQSLAALAQRRFDYVVVATSAGGFSDERYRSVYVDGLAHLLEVIAARPPRRLLLVSSTSVYHQVGGEWVDESSVTEPQGFAGKRLLQAEALALGSGVATTVLRFSGIYGPGRDRLIRQVAERGVAPATPVRITNRIHSDDCAAVIDHLLALDRSGAGIESLYLASDCEPAAAADVQRFIAKRLGIEPRVDLDATDPRRGGNKRCSNRRLLASGYRFMYPTYREGYGALMDELTGAP